VYNSTAISSSGTGGGTINIQGGDSATTVDGKYVDSGVSGGPNDSYLTGGILFPRMVNGTEYTKFLNRKPDGRPDLGNVYKPTGTTGAMAFYADDKPVPNF
jgi:hypothetical protein